MLKTDEFPNFWIVLKDFEPEACLLCLPHASTIFPILTQSLICADDLSKPEILKSPILDCVHGIPS
jgi:hypothetical protein